MHPWRPITSEYDGLLFSFCTVPGEELRDIELVHNAMMRTRCQSKLNDDKYLGIEGVVGTKRAFTAVRHHEEVAAARCLGVTASISASTIPHSSSSSELSLEGFEDGDS
jgi:hypothetical protein